MASREDPRRIADLQVTQKNIRNFCILAHVDHGKTTLSDSLVSSNGIISAKLAGKLRYLDSTEEEQKRGITMHSSAISLLFRNEDRASGENKPTEETPQAEEFLINLIDSPGHIDFSSDVSTATRLCDGALLVVDVLEGICTQTHAVIYKALKERMKPCLVLNKIDRLCLDMHLSTTEAFQHLKRLLEQVNALAYTLLKSEMLRRSEIQDEVALKNGTSINTSSSNTINANGEDIEDDPLFTDWNFEPDKGNVIFCSALDCWGFGTTKFANIWSKRLGLNKNVVRKYIFEDYAYNASTKKIVKCGDMSRGGGGGAGEAKPMFASMILDPLWQLYESAVVQQDVTKAANMASKGVRETKRLFYVIALQCFNDACVNYDLRVMLETPKLNSCILHFSILTLSLFLTL
jgi:ribosome assembly protein 1